MGSRVVVVVAPPGPVPAAVRDVVRDWVALGLLQPLVWVESGEVPAGASLSEVVGSLLLPDSAPRVRLQEHLGNQRSLDLVRLVALGSLGVGGTTLVPAQLAGALNTSLNASAPGRVVPLQCVLVRLGGEEAPAAQLAVPGWRTLVVAPEDSWSPDSLTTEFAAAGDDAEFVAHAAAGLASVAGLWRGVDRGAFDDAVTDNDDPQVVRAYLRRLDASALTSGLRHALSDVSGGLPLPRSGSGRLAALQDPPAGAAQVHRALLARNEDLLALRLREVEAGDRTKLGTWAAIKMFFAFLVQSLRNAPGAFLDKVRTRTAATVAGAVQGALFGSDSRYEVITRGVNAEGRPVGVAEISAVATEVQARVQGHVPTETALPDLSRFWSDVSAGALSLADGGDHGSSVGPVAVGGEPRVARDPAVIAPAPSEAFVLPHAVAARVGTSTVSPYDERAQAQAAESLGGLGGADTTAESFARWRRTCAASYTGLLGAHLARLVDERAAVLAGLLERLRQQSDTVDTGEISAAMRRSRSLLLQLLLALVVVGAVIAAVAYFDLLETLVLVLVAVLLVSGVVIGGLFGLVAQQRRVFALLHAQRSAADELEVAAENVPVAARSLQLVSTLYAQHLAWAPVLGRFLREPFGPVPQPAPPARLQGTLPRAVGFGVAQAEPERLEEVAHDLGSAVFDRGWMQPLWEALLDDAPRALGAAGLPLRDDPRGMLLSDPATTAQSPLRQWSAHVATEGVSSSAGDALWRRARGALLERGAGHLTDRLLTRVEVQAQQAHGITEPVSGREFLTELTDALGDVERHHFSPRLFSDLAATSDRHRVTRTVLFGRAELADLSGSGASRQVQRLEPAGDDDGLDQFVVVVQTSGTVPSADLLVQRAPSGPPPPVQDDEPGDPDADGLV